MGWYVLIWIGLIAVLSVWSFHSLRPRPKRVTKRVFVDKIHSNCRLGEGDAYVLFVFRQSGNEQQPKRAFYSLTDVLDAAVSTFRRAGIEEVRIVQNTEDRFEFERTVHDHRGTAEGKKVGAIEIVRVVSK